MLKKNIYNLFGHERVKSQNGLDLTFFNFYTMYKFLFSYDYFRILKLCDIEIDVDVEKNIYNLKFIIFIFSLNYTPISDICLYLHVTVETEGNMDTL